MSRVRTIHHTSRDNPQTTCGLRKVRHEGLSTTHNVNSTNCDNCKRKLAYIATTDKPVFFIDESTHIPTFTPRPGAARSPGVGGVDWIYANPGDQLYSTVCMVATHYWDGHAWAGVEGVTHGND